MTAHYRLPDTMNHKSPLGDVHTSRYKTCTEQNLPIYALTQADDATSLTTSVVTSENWSALTLQLTYMKTKKREEREGKKILERQCENHDPYHTRQYCVKTLPSVPILTILAKVYEVHDDFFRNHLQHKIIYYTWPDRAG